MRVCHVITKLELGGAQLTTLASVKALDGELFRSFLVSGNGGMLTGDARKLNGTRVIFIKELGRNINPFLDALSLFKLYRLFVKENPGIVHTHSSKAGILGRWAAKLARTPFIMHTVHGWGFNDYQNVITRKFFILLERRTARITTKIICVSEAARDKGVQEGIGEKSQYSVIRSGIEIKRFSECKVNVLKKRREFGFSGDMPLVGMVACFKKQKAPLDFIEASSILLKKKPGIQFLMVGDGYMRERIEKRIKKSGLEGKIVLCGWREDIPELMRSIDVIALTSIYEGLPRVILEAMASGKAVVATDVGGMREVVTDGVSGFLLPPKKPSEMADKLYHILSNQAMMRRMGEKGKESLGDDFDISVMINRLQELYLSLVKEKKPA